MNESMSVYLHLKKYNLDTIEHLTITKIRYRRALQTCFFLKKSLGPLKVVIGVIQQRHLNQVW